jgi:hypothetical protein
MVELTEEQYQILKDNYQFAQEIKSLQEPLSKSEITHLRKLVKQNIKEGYTNYLRLITVYSENRDSMLGIYVRGLYISLL